MDIIQLYLQDIKKYPTLEPEEQLALFRKYKEGDLVAYEKLIQCNLKYVISVAKSYAKTGTDLEDIISAGNEGLIKAVQNYNPDKGYRFTTYAIWWIRQSILTADAELKNLIRIPSNRQVDMHKARKLEDRKVQELGRSLSQTELNELSYYDNTHLTQLNNTVSLNDLDENDHEMIHTFLYPVDESIDQTIDQEALRESVNELLADCSFKEKDILTLYMGLGDLTPLTLEQIGKLYNLSRERIRQIKELTLKKLREKKK